MRNKKLIKTPKINNNKIVPNSAINNISSYFAKNPSWSFDYVDENEDEYNIFMNCSGELLKQLQSLERMTWQEILSASGGRNYGTNSHFIPIEAISKVFKKKLQNLKYISEDLRAIFSLRLQGKLRLIGLIDENTGVFKIIWYDAKHEVYELSS